MYPINYEAKPLYPSYIGHPLDSIVRPFHVAYQHVNRAISAETPLAQRIAHLAWAFFEIIPLFNYPIVWLDEWVHQRTLCDLLVTHYASIWNEAPELIHTSRISFQKEDLNNLRSLRDPMTKPFMKTRTFDNRLVLLFKSDAEFVAISGNHLFSVTANGLNSNHTEWGSTHTWTSQDLADIFRVRYKTLNGILEILLEHHRFKLAAHPLAERLNTDLSNYICSPYLSS